MSAAKRSRRRQPEAEAISPLPASKRQKTDTAAHVPKLQSGLGFLVDEDARSGRKLSAKLTNGVASSKTSRPDETRAVVTSGTKADDTAAKRPIDDTIDISSDDDSDEAEVESEEEDVEDDAEVEDAERLLLNGHAKDSDDEEEDVEDMEEDVDTTAPSNTALTRQEVDEEDVEDAGEPSFGAMLKARHPEPIDVQASFADVLDQRTVAPTNSSKALVTLSAGSLSTVMTQALKTNDRDLLETCFQIGDIPTIRATVERLQPQLVSSLLSRLAERMYKRPGRTGVLLTWVQWSMVAHGGYLANQPDVMHKLKALSQVMRERAQGIEPLLHLKGKLDLLSAQLDLRRRLQAANREAHAEDEDDEDNVLYVEGQEEDMGSDADVAVADRDGPTQPSRGTARRKPVSGKAAPPESDEDESMDELANGGMSDSGEESGKEDEGEEEGEGLLDIEAEEASDDEEDDDAGSSGEDEDSAADSEDISDVSEDEESEIEVAAPAPKNLSRKR